MTDVLQFLLMLTALFLLLAAAGALLELIEVLRRDPLPPPDDPRLRNVEGIREWRERKQKIRGKWVS